MNFASIIISAICIILVGFCMYSVIKNIRNQIQGKGCGKCHKCSSMCSKQIKDNQNQNNNSSM